jgi:signal transduction histidine kinase
MNADPSEVKESAPAALVGLEDATHAVGHIAGELVHALRNPVASLKTSVELLTSGTADASDIPALHQVMRNSLTKLDDLLGRCREIAKLTTLSLEPHDLAVMLRARLSAREREFAAQGIRVNTSITSDPTPLRADEDHLGAAIDALLANAFEAMPEGGEIFVSLAVEPPSEKSGHKLGVLTVRDTGHGIAPTILPNVFRLFYTTRKGALGLGLPLARQVLVAHGATIALASEPNVGTTATVHIPIGT